ncbi:MAG: hypothetical protein MJ054_01815, partial [Clostridia bacterium]|nr:hypothetical protein [Clostridia bacterium]
MYKELVELALQEDADIAACNLCYV